MAAPKGNKFAVGLTTNGRPPKFKSEKELLNKIIAYFDLCKPKINNEGVNENPENLTETGLALFLGFESRQSIYDYKDKEDFSYIIKRALLVIENHYETRLIYSNPTGAIFALKNMDWKDKTEIEGQFKNDTKIDLSNISESTLLKIASNNSNNKEK